jgi:hypothetical protein
MNIPWSSEALAVNSSNGSLIDIPIATDVTVISNVSCIHAHSITVFIQVVAGALAAPGVTIRKYAANRTFYVDTNVVGVLAAPATAAVDSTAAIGQTYDLIVHGGAAGATVRVWTCARSQ